MGESVGKLGFHICLRIRTLGGRALSLFAHRNNALYYCLIHSNPLSDLKGLLLLLLLHNANKQCCHGGVEISAAALKRGHIRNLCGQKNGRPNFLKIC
jgi:hypothetical protein